MISFEEFKKIELKVGKIEKAEKIKGSEKLLKLTIDLGQEKREIVAGIAKEYSPESLKEKEVIIVTNLEPKKIMGIESQGMLLAANFEGKPVLIVPEKRVPPGTKVQ